MKHVEPNSHVMQKIIGLLPGIITVYDINTRVYVYVNDSVETLLGYSKKEWLSKGTAFPMSLIHPEDLSAIVQQNKEAIRKANEKRSAQSSDQPIMTFEYRVKHKDGSWKWFKTDGVILERDEKDKVKLLMNISIDITQRKVNELEERTKREIATVALENSEAKFKRLFDANIIGVFISDFDGKYLDANDALLDMIGYSREDLTKGKIHRDILTPPEYQEVSNLAMQELLAKGSSAPHEKEYIRKDGERINVLLAVAQIADSPICIGYILDITHMKKIEEGQARLAAIVESSDDAIISKSLKGIIRSWNHSAEKLFGYTEEEAIGKHIGFIIPKELVSEEEKIIKNIRLGKPTHHFETVRLRKDGKKIMVSLSVSPVKNSKGVVIGASKIARDISKQKELERQKDEFLGIASHELKTPVTSIKSFAQVLRLRFSREGNQKAADLLGKLDTQVDKLTNLIGDLLDVTKIESGKMLFNEDVFPFDELVDEVVEELQRITEKHVLIQKGKTNKKVKGDRERIGQVLTNFITNAIKYSPTTQEIIIQSSIDEKNVKVSVQDFGVGIAKEKQEQVFERFFRVSGPGKDTYPGLGLGLYISSEIIKRSGGKIWVESSKDNGSTFIFTLPFLL